MKLHIQDLSFSYGSHQVLQNVSFFAKKGDLMAILGPNGTGKTTLFRCILGTLPHYLGNITIDGENIRNMGRQELAKRLAYIPQAHGAAFSYSVLDMVLMGTARQLSPFSSPGHRQISAAEDALSQVGISDLAQRSFSHLSGGERQLVLIARALAQQADILIMDEPTSNLDFGNQLRILEKIRQLAHSGYTILLSTHNPQHALAFSSNILALTDGHVAAFGPPQQHLTPELLQKLYQVNTILVDTPAGKSILPCPLNTNG